mgnify:CR=1 FL=1
MTLLADRVRLLDTENAFKIGPYISAVEAMLPQRLDTADFHIHSQTIRSR